MSVRTLQRRLGELDTTYQDVYGAFRHNQKLSPSESVSHIGSNMIIEFIACLTLHALNIA